MHLKSVHCEGSVLVGLTSAMEAKTEVMILPRSIDMLRKLSLVALFCFSPIAMSESVTAGHGCHHSRAVATAYRAPAGHFHARHRHHRVHPGHRAHRCVAPQAACCGPAVSSVYRPPVPYGGYGQAAPYSARPYGTLRGYGNNRSPSTGLARPSYGAAYGGFRGGSPFSRPLDLSIDVGGMPGFGW